MPSSETVPLISSGPRQKSPLPSLYYHFFSKVEPLGLLGGAAWAIFFPTSFFKAYLGESYNDTLDKTGGHRGQLVASGMGSCELDKVGWREPVGSTMLTLDPISYSPVPPFARHAHHRYHLARPCSDAESGPQALPGFAREVHSIPVVLPCHRRCASSSSLDIAR